MSRRVLLVEDDSELGAQIVHRLRDNGFEAEWWREGRRVTQEDLRGFDLVIVDLMLPGVYGMDMLKDVRACSEVPVLVLSARDATADKVRALKLGADDYMTKPFWPEELLERVRARLRRPALGRGDVLEAGALRIDRARREVQWKGERIELTRVEFEFLSALAERPGEAMTRRALAERALDPERDGGERTLDVHVSRLRKKLAQMGETSLIETVWGIGYRLAP
ncbi:response regulator transcription factor [Pendulispora brunnea]|uniref:Response regulator transcription factor n=1 Tax=Pendulispora brunnea TaxID=2905690 RepID=A0ABZ2KNB4_9BACT